MLGFHAITIVTRYEVVLATTLFDGTLNGKATKGEDSAFNIPFLAPVFKSDR